MGFYRCRNNERFPGMVERQNWKGILNALGERMGNVHGVGDDAVITQVKEYEAVRVESEFQSTVISYSDHKESGQRQIAANDYQTFSDIPYYEVIRNRQIMLGGTLSTHTCNNCMGWGEVECPMCSGRGHTMLNGKMNICSSCSGTGKTSCPDCGGTGKYQTFKTVTASDKTDFYLYCPVEALAVMIKKQNIQTDVLYQGSCLKMRSSGETEHDDLATLYTQIEKRLGADVKAAFQEDFEKEYNRLKEKKNNILDEISVHAVCSPIIEIQYQYRKKEFSLYISKQTPAVYCYKKFPGRVAQRIRELFSSDKKIDRSNSKPTGKPIDRKLGDSYGSKYQK